MIVNDYKIELGADLRGADLRNADLQDADLRDANLEGADLQGADLQDANLYGANLRHANLRGANLRGASLRNADVDSRTIGWDSCVASTRVAAEGDLIGWKKCRHDVIVKLLIPADAKRSNAFGRKCRAEYAKVLDIIGADEGVSSRNAGFEYKVGKTVYPDSFDPDFRNECSHGIHFFVTRKEAEDY